MEESVYSRPVLLFAYSLVHNKIYCNVYKNFEDKINELMKCTIFILQVLSTKLCLVKRISINLLKQNKAKESSYGFTYEIAQHHTIQHSSEP